MTIAAHIQSDAPHGKVSWQVTGIRHGPFILAHPIIPEVDKGGTQQGEQNDNRNYEAQDKTFFASS